MKAGMLSRKPKEVKNLLDGILKYIVAKKMLPLNTPIYVYCTKDKMILSQLDILDYETMNLKGKKFDMATIKMINSGIYNMISFTPLNGKVVAKIEFDDYKVIAWENDYLIIGGYYVDEQMLKESCISYQELEHYGKGKTLYFHHISKVEILDNPMEIGEFKVLDKELMKMIWTNDKKYKPLSKAPQSYCYVEVSDNAK